MTIDDENHITRTSPKRLGQGLAVVVGIMIVGAAIAITNWDKMDANPPPSSKIKPEIDLSTVTAGSHGVPPGFEQAQQQQQAGGPGAAAGPTPTATGDVTLTVLEGAATQGNPDYEPKELKVTKGQTILVDNVDLMPHTVTNGEGASDPNSAKIFDTGIINGGESAVLETSNVEAGSYKYYCTVHPYMIGTLAVE